MSPSRHILRLAAAALAALLPVAPAQAGNPQRAEHFLRRGLEAMQQGELSKAEDLFLRARRAEPILPEPEALLGKVSLIRGEYDRAEASFETAIELYRSLRSALQLEVSRRRQDSMDNLDMISRSQSRLQSSPSDVAQSRYVHLEATKVREEHKLGQDQVPDEEIRIPAEVFLLLGNARLRAGRAEAAIPAYRDAIDREPDAPEPHHNLAVALIQVGRLDEAQVECERARSKGYAPSVELHKRIEEMRASAGGLEVE